MRTLILLWVLVCWTSFFAHAQGRKVLEAIQPDTTFENIWVKPLYSDKNASTYIIWIRNEIRAHKHLRHTEHVYIIEGKGEMTLGFEKIIVEKGDWITIPENTPHSVKVLSKKPLKVLSIQSPEFLGDDRIWIEDK